MTAPDFSPAAIQQERARVLGLIEAVEAAETAFHNYQPATLQPLELQQGTGGNMLVSMTPEEYALQRTLHAAQTRVEKLGLDTARDYVEALRQKRQDDARFEALMDHHKTVSDRLELVLVERERLREALETISAGVDIADREKTASPFMYTIRKIARAALASAPEERP